MKLRGKIYFAGVFQKLKQTAAGLWHYYLDIPILGKITMMLVFCVSGYILIGAFYMGGILGIRNQLNDFNLTMSKMFDTSDSISANLNIIKSDLLLLKKNNASILQKDSAVKDAWQHFKNLSLLLSRLKKEHPLPERDLNGQIISYWPLTERGSVLAISTQNALENIGTQLSFLKENVSKEKGVALASGVIDEYVENIAQSLIVMDRLASAIRQFIASYTTATIANINHQVMWRLVAGFLVTGLVMLVLVVASYAWGVFLIGPLRQMADKLGSVQTRTMNLDKCTTISPIPILGNDEIGKVGRATNNLLQHMRAIYHFRRTIESDETATEVYHRLGQVFKTRLDLQSFVIYETKRDKDKMVPVYVEPPELMDELAETHISSEKCRAWRTGSFVTSFQDEGICPVFAWQNALTHACIPMTVGGEMLGVVQFIFPYVDNPEREQAFERALLEAKFYLSEAMPVIKAKLLAQRLTESATQDPLTGLFNRRYLEMNLDSLVARAKRSGSSLGILMCDLDYFKEVNDKYGHDTGDMVLAQLARIIRKHARESDLVIRFGGEEFLVLLVDCEPGFAEQVAERIRKAVEEYVFHFPGIDFSKKISLGVSEFPEDTEQIWEAIKYADVALYRAKEEGRNRIVRFRPEMWGKLNF